MSDDIVLPVIAMNLHYSAESVQRYARRAVIADRERRTQPAPGAEALDLVKRLADHLENTDSIPLLKWGVKGCFLVNEARSLIAAHSGKGTENA